MNHPDFTALNFMEKFIDLQRVKHAYSTQLSSWVRCLVFGLSLHILSYMYLEYACKEGSSLVAFVQDPMSLHCKPIP